MSEHAIAQAQTTAPASRSRISTTMLQRKCACGQHTMGGECAECKKKEMGLQRKSAGLGSPNEAPPIVHEVLRSPGEPLDADTRGLMESRFGQDFSRVRVHTGAQAAKSAQDVNALAYTVGKDVVFGPGKYAPASREGNRLLTHELAHVLQQEGEGHALPGKLRIRPPGDSAEREADLAAEQVTAGSAIPSPREIASGLQRDTCESILNAQEGAPVSGNEAERQIHTDFILHAGSRVTSFDVPTSSSTAYRTECGGREKSIKPQKIGGKQAGVGRPDLMLINGSRVELAEIKIGTWQCREFAEKQINNYKEKGDEEADWRRSLGIRGFDLMPPSRFTPPNLTINGQTVYVGWCGPGVIVYKPVQKSNDEVFLCSNISDRGSVDRFLDKLLDQGQRAVDRFVDKTISPMFDRFAKEKLAEKGLGIAADVALEMISALKARVIEMVRKEMKNSLRQHLQQSLNTLCATAAAKGLASAKDLLKNLDQQMAPLILVPALIAVAQQLALEAAAKVLDVLAKVALAIAIAVVIAILFFFLRGMPTQEGEPMPGGGFAPPMMAGVEPGGNRRKGGEQMSAETA